jgi:hypothetical protein
VVSARGSKLKTRPRGGSRYREASPFSAFVELRGLLSSNKELATKVHSLERKVSVHERNIAELADSMAELLAMPAPPPKRPIGFISPEDKGKKASGTRGKTRS